MKTALPWIALLAAVAFLLAVPAPVAAENPEIVLTITDGESRLNDIEIFLGVPLDELTALMGEPDRVRKGVNEVLIWDELGVRAYRKPRDPSAETLAFTMKAQESELHPKRPFSGKIVLPQGTITAKTKKKKLERLGFRPDATSPKFYRLPLLAGGLFAEIDPEDGRLVSLSVSFGL